MTGKIKLVHSGGNSVSVAVPTNAPSASEVEFKLPQADGTSGQVLKTDGSGNLSFAGTGKILQVVQAVKTDVFTSNSTTYTDVTGLSLSITPSSTSSKILVNVSFSHQSDTQDRWRAFQITRGSTAIYIGNADGSRNRASIHTSLISGSGDAVTQDNSSIQFLDSPNTTSAVTYYLQGKVQSGAYFVINRARITDNADYNGRTASSITLMEVAA